MDETARKDELIASLLPDVPFDGWSMAAMRTAARRIAMDEDELRRLFPRGVRDALLWFSHWADRLMLETVAARPEGGRPVHERIAEAIRTRLRLLAPYREAVRRGLSLLSLPPYAPLGAKLLYDTVDAAWYAAGDVSTDFSFYTKRGMLAAIYGATMLYWLDDRSEGSSATEAFLDRRLRDVSALPRIRAGIERAGRHIPNPLRLFRVPRPRF
ncbi:MAG TPA: COQ9 family protein [Stellaceae bacterium]|nr:COQ9 family protein [Stellaceae bacterium]